MDPIKFNSMGELENYLSAHEERIAALETQNRQLREKLEKSTFSHEQISDAIDDALPNSSIFSDNFLTRAFAIWGHYFVAQLMIGVIILAVYLVIFVVILGGIAINH
jgi:hypothetical protein